jgi:hypothetical protein
MKPGKPGITSSVYYDMFKRSGIKLKKVAIRVSVPACFLNYKEPFQVIPVQTHLTVRVFSKFYTIIILSAKLFQTELETKK